MNTIHVGSIPIGPEAPLCLIAGPCVIESDDQCRLIGQTLRDACNHAGLSFVFKASFDKANRSSVSSPRGPGLSVGLHTLRRVGEDLGVPTTTDIHEPVQAAEIAKAVDLVQIPAFLCRQTDLLVAAARTGKPVNVKKGQFMSPAEMSSVVDKLTTPGPPGNDPAGVMLTERGTFFGYNRLVNDFVGFVEMQQLGWPVCFDATHSTQLPGGLSSAGGRTSGGRPEFAPMLARCAVIAGANAVFLEAHPDPPSALSDATTVLPLHDVPPLIAELAELRRLYLSRLTHGLSSP